VSIVLGVALSLIVSNKLISLNIYDEAIKSEINKELTIIK
jgi:hypothetical protein